MFEHEIRLDLFQQDTIRLELDLSMRPIEELRVVPDLITNLLPEFGVELL